VVNLEFGEDVRLCLTVGCVVLLVMAFVASMPASVEAERIKAIESAQSWMGHQPNIGPFQWKDLWVRSYYTGGSL